MVNILDENKKEALKRNKKKHLKKKLKWFCTIFIFSNFILNKIYDSEYSGWKLKRIK